MKRLSPLLLPLVATPALAQTTLDYTLDAQTSSLQLNTSVGLELSGDLRGVFDQATNPGGTRTQRGIFGDDGTNQSASLSLALALGLDLDGALGGAFTLTMGVRREGGANAIMNVFFCVFEMSGRRGRQRNKAPPPASFLAQRGYRETPVCGFGVWYQLMDF